MKAINRNLVARQSTHGPVGSRSSLVIPTKNRAPAIERLLHLLVARGTQLASAGIGEIVIVDQSASPSLSRLPNAAWSSNGDEPRLMYLHAPWIDGAAAARNAGFRMSSAPYVIFLDDDALPEQGCLELLVQVLDRHPQLYAAGGLVSNYTPPPLPARLFRRIFYRPPLYDERQPVYWRARDYATCKLIPSSKLTGCCMVFRREALERCGGFDARYRGASVGEDVEISVRLARLANRPDAIALVGGAFVRHASEGGWKHNPRSIEFEIVATHYWLRRGYPWNLANRFRFAWMCAGLLLWTLASSLKRRDPAPLRSFLAGVRSTRSGYRGCPFLGPEPADGGHQP